MDTQLLTVLISTSGSVIVGVVGMFFTANQLGRRIDDTNQRIVETNHRIDTTAEIINQGIRELRLEFNTFKDLVNGKLSAIDLEIAKLMDRRN